MLSFWVCNFYVLCDNHKCLWSIYCNFLESLVFFRNYTTVIPVAQARGILLASLIRHQVKIVEYSPPQIKMSVTGFGRADKKAIEKMVRLQFKFDELALGQTRVLDDTFDAMAVLLTHAGSRGLSTRVKASFLLIGVTGSFETVVKLSPDRTVLRDLLAHVASVEVIAQGSEFDFWIVEGDGFGAGTGGSVISDHGKIAGSELDIV